MGETLHCQAHTNSSVLWKPYLEEKLTYQYSGEALQTIQGKGLTYTTQQAPPSFLGGQCPQTQYYCTIEFFNAWSNAWRTASTASGYGLLMYAPITGWKLDPIPEIPSRAYIVVTGRDGAGNPVQHVMRWNGVGPVIWNGQHNLSRTANDLKNFKVVFNASGQQDTGLCGNPPPGDCTFKVFQNGTEIFNRVNANCPTVKQFPCEVDLNTANQKINVIKNSNEFVLISDKQYSINAQGFLQSSPLPANALNVYKVTPKSSIDANNQYQLIQQITSQCADKRPVYQVSCINEQLEECPSGTCKVECGNHYCCYNEQGISVKVINK